MDDDRPREASPDSSEPVLEPLTRFELKLQQLQKELRGQDLAAVMKDMDEEKASSRRFSRRFPPALAGSITLVSPDHDLLPAAL